MVSAEILTEADAALFTEASLSLMTEATGAPQAVLRTDSRIASVRVSRADTSYILTAKGEVQSLPTEDSN